ncbi:MAG: FHA domain-containing serine/threonine-protein kinase [Planctomycetota bacterium]
MKAELSIVSGYPERTLPIQAGRPVTIGRSKAADIQILHSVVSRLHCQVAHDGTNWVLKDLESSNGVWVDGHRVRQHVLGDGDTFHLGKRIEFRLTIRAATEEIPPPPPASETAVSAAGLVGREIDGVRVVEEVFSEGPLSRLRAHQPSLNRQVMLHAFRESGLETEDFKNKLLEEVRGVSRLLHPSVLQIHDMIEHGGFLLVVMEYAEGDTLQDILTKRRFVNVPATLKIASQIADALSHADDQDLIVNRVAPGDVYVSDDNQVKVELFRPPLPVPASVAELPYVAPELIESGVLRAGTARPPASDRETAARSAVYSVASMMYHMLAGIPPHEGQTTEQLLPKIMKDRPPSLRRVNLKVSPALARIVERAMGKDPAARHANFRELRADLQKIISPAL